MPSSTETSPLSLHDALPIFTGTVRVHRGAGQRRGMERPGAPLGGGPRAALCPGRPHHELRLRVKLTGRVALAGVVRAVDESVEDRKSTRLNSSHVEISYAVFHRDLPSFPTRRSSDLHRHRTRPPWGRAAARHGTSRCAPRRRSTCRPLPRPSPPRASAPGEADRPCSARRRRSSCGRERRRSEEHTSELQSRRDLVCRLPPRPPLFPYTTLFRSSPAPYASTVGPGSGAAWNVPVRPSAAVHVPPSAPAVPTTSFGSG